MVSVEVEVEVATMISFLVTGDARVHCHLIHVRSVKVVMVLAAGWNHTQRLETLFLIMLRTGGLPIVVLPLPDFHLITMRHQYDERGLVSPQLNRTHPALPIRRRIGALVASSSLRPVQVVRASPVAGLVH